MDNKSAQVNYQTTTSNNANYQNIDGTANPESFPEKMENGVIVKYEISEISETS